jgi:large subunit ribosomal protein L6
MRRGGPASAAKFSARSGNVSRIGNKPIPVPAKVKVDISAAAIRVEGPKGKLEVVLPRGVRFERQGENLVALRDGDQWRAFHGLARALVANAVSGVDRGFKKEMDIVGVGYRAEVKGRTVVFSLGYSHPVEFPIPTGIDITVDRQTHITITGADKALVGQVTANIRSLRPPDPYKQKGIQISGERLKKKAGKAGLKAGA